MGLDNARRRGSAIQIDDPRVDAVHRFDTGIAANNQKMSVRDSDSRGPWRGTVDRRDPSVALNDVRNLGRIGDG